MGLFKARARRSVTSLAEQVAKLEGELEQERRINEQLRTAVAKTTRNMIDAQDDFLGQFVLAFEWDEFDEWIKGQSGESGC